MLAEVIRQGIGKKENYNCAEKIIHGANIAYHLGIDDRSCHLISGFGGGMCVGKTCGAAAGAVSVLGYLFVEDHARESERIRSLAQEFFRKYEAKLGASDCRDLIKVYRSSETRCDFVIGTAAEILDEIVERELKKDNREVPD